MNLFLGKLICKWRGHKRGVQMERPFSERELGINSYRCSRCGATWTRRARKVKP